MPARFRLYLIKPSHYDDDGYVIQWLRSAIPSNSLAVMHGLAEDCRARGAVGEDFDIVAMDETNTRIRPERIAAEIARGGGRGLVCLVGVQSNQFPRAMDIARRLRGGGRAGRHRRLPCLRLPRHAAGDAGRSEARRRRLASALFAGEAEGRLDMVLRDAAAGALKPLYNFMNDLPALEGAPIPILSAALVKRTAGAGDELRRRARLSVSMLVLHHHQRAGAQVALPHARRRRGDHPRQSRQRHRPFLHHRRQSRAQQELGADLRPADRDAQRGEAVVPFRHPGRHAGPPHPALHREGGGGGRAAGVPRVGEHQPREPRRRQEEAEPHRRISRDAARVEGGRLFHLRRLYPRLSRRHAGNDRARHRDHQARIAARSAGVLLPDAAAGLGGPSSACRATASRWTPT